MDFDPQKLFNFCRFAKKYKFTQSSLAGLGPKACANHIIAIGYRQCLPRSVVQLKAKHCRHPIPVMGVAHAFQLGLMLVRCCYGGN